MSLPNECVWDVPADDNGICWKHERPVWFGITRRFAEVSDGGARLGLAMMFLVATPGETTSSVDVGQVSLTSLVADELEKFAGGPKVRGKRRRVRRLARRLHELSTAGIVRVERGLVTLVGYKDAVRAIPVVPCHRCDQLQDGAL